MPFRFFLKIKNKSLSQRLQNQKRGAPPSTINKNFHKKRVEASFISSIKSAKANKTRSGIVAKKEVKSVIAKLGGYKKDAESDTSNILAKVLGVAGEVYIGDKALNLYLKAPSDYIDLAALWNQKTSLPFVFGRFCFNKRGGLYHKLSSEFNRKKIRLPYYILKAESSKRGLKQKEALAYLKLITYKIGAKEEASFRLFIKKAKKI